MPTTSDNYIEKALSEIDVPFLGRNMLSAGAVYEPTADGSELKIALKLGFYLGADQAAIEADLAAAVRTATGNPATVSISSEVVGHTVQGTLTPLEGVKNLSLIHI